MSIIEIDDSFLNRFFQNGRRKLSEKRPVLTDPRGIVVDFGSQRDDFEFARQERRIFFFERSEHNMKPAEICRKISDHLRLENA